MELQHFGFLEHAIAYYVLQLQYFKKKKVC
jgi:hypothetical protein